MRGQSERHLVDAPALRETECGNIVPMERESGIAQGNKVRVMAGSSTGTERVFRGYLCGGERACGIVDFVRRRSLVVVDVDLTAVVRA